MIESSSIINWRKNAPWRSDAQVEQDLILSRALIDIFNHPFLKEALVFRGGTALQKLFYDKATRYSEDLDFVQIRAGGIGEILDALREVLGSWLGKSKNKFGEGRATLLYGFEPTLEKQISKMRIKIEINTREHFTVMGLLKKPYGINTSWYSGSAEVTSYYLEELLGTKLRALYQRRKGRDLFDIAIALKALNVDVTRMIDCFSHYLERQNLKVSRAEFEENLYQKFNQPAFREDMRSLLAGIRGNHQSFEEDFNLIMQKVIALLPGDPWKMAQH